MQSQDFPSIFKALTGVPPFPWQTALYHRFINGDFPSSASLPTGLGKTSIIAIWLCALATESAVTAIPRRLVYVVNRRTVVDQTTSEVERLRDALTKNSDLAEIRSALTSLCALPLPTPDASPLAVSTLRGQFADNGEWCADPTRPAVVVGTVDMIGSGLLFSRYTRGFKTRPLHAGFLAQDALLIHDEAHLEPAFQCLLESIVATQRTGADARKLRVIALTATHRSSDTENDSKPFGLDENPDDKDSDNETVEQRINAAKRLTLVRLNEDEKLDAKLVSLAKAKPGGRAILVFVRSVEVATKVAAELDKGEHEGRVALLTGTLRGKERDDLASKNRVFQCFLSKKDRVESIEPARGTVYLVATSAGEVGVNLSADDLVCDLSTYESMAQRFGRVNRFGLRDDSEIIVVHEAEFDTGKPLEAARERTLALLRQLDGNASPAALEGLPADARAAAYSPPPAIRIATDIQYDAWALSTIRQPIAARPPVAPYLHGEAEWQPPETHLAWRDDRDFKHIGGDTIEDFVETFPLLPRELLRDRSDRIFDTLGDLVAAALQKENSNSDAHAWLVDELGRAKTLPLAPFAISTKSKKERTKQENEELERMRELISDAILILPASLGGLDEMGMFSSSAKYPAAECSGIERRETELQEAADFSREISDEDAEESRYLLWFAPANNGSALPRKTTPSTPETVAAHTHAVTANAAAIAVKLFSDTPAPDAPDLGRCVVAAARIHDLGKNRAQWQRNLGNLIYDSANPDTIFAKSGGKMRPRIIAEYYRHEFGSLIDAERDPEFTGLSETEREIVLHLVAAHHGRARPHFPLEESFDYSGSLVASVVAAETPRRFAALQKRFGRWGLAWLESLLRAADYAASAGIVAQGAPTTDTRSTPPPPTGHPHKTPPPTPSATLVVNPANPGHYFACCGLFELAARQSPDALAWFEQSANAFRFHLANTESLAEFLEKVTAAGITTLDPDDATASPIFIGTPFNLRVDWWKTADAATSSLKVWAGTMEAPRIARAMQKAIRSEDGETILTSLRIAYAPEEPTKKVEPFYFDANRGPNSDARDVGFSINDLGLETLAAPAAEFLTLVGLQRAIPRPSGERLFDYHLWQTPVPIALLAAAINGFTEERPPSFRFESWYRTSQRKHKAFLPAKPL